MIYSHARLLATVLLFSAYQETIWTDYQRQEVDKETLIVAVRYVIL